MSFSPFPFVLTATFEQFLEPLDVFIARRLREEAVAHFGVRCAFGEIADGAWQCSF